MKLGPTGVGACTSYQGIPDDEIEAELHPYKRAYDRVEIEVNTDGIPELQRALTFLDESGPGSHVGIVLGGDGPGWRKLLRLVHGNKPSEGK